MASLMELIDRVNKGEMIDSAQLEIYQESSNSAEKFLAHHAHAMLDLRRAQQHMMQSLEAIDYSDQKVLNQFISVSSFLDLTDLRAGPVVKFGACAIGRREFALGLEAIQNGVSYDMQNGGSWTADRDNCQFIATQYERAAQCIGWSSNQSLEWNNKQTTLAVIVSGIADEDTAGRFVRSLARYYDAKRFKLMIYSTEAAVRREKQLFGQTSHLASSTKRGAATISELAKQRISVWTAPADGDVVSAAKALADQLIKDRVDVALIDASQSDSIAATVANWEIAPVKINLCRRSPLYTSNVNCVTYFDPIRFEADREYWQKRGVDAKYILEGIDIDAGLGALPLRAQYGIPENAVVLATTGADLDRSLSEEFVETIVNILRAHPHAIYLLIGEGELSWQKRRFESAGIAKRVGYAGKRKDLPGFLRIADMYLCEFPAGTAQGALMAMSVERPVVAMKCGEEAEQSQAATLVGSEGSISGKDPSAYIERVSKIIREAGYRQKLGKMMRSRVEQHFGFGQTARHIEQLCEQLIQSRTESTASEARRIVRPAAPNEAVAQVA
jgi:predicted O-linked N-acetylglucosamine transferase (SPINDLY family)